MYERDALPESQLLPLVRRRYSPPLLDGPRLSTPNSRASLLSPLQVVLAQSLSTTQRHPAFSSSSTTTPDW